MIFNVKKKRTQIYLTFFDFFPPTIHVTNYENKVIDKNLVILNSIKSSELKQSTVSLINIFRWAMMKLK